MLVHGTQLVQLLLVLTMQAVTRRANAMMDTVEILCGKQTHKFGVEHARKLFVPHTLRNTQHASVAQDM
jgi:hypothetical protein